MKTIIIIATGMLLIGTLPAMATGRFISKINLPSGQTVVVVEGLGPEADPVAALSKTESD